MNLRRFLRVVTFGLMMTFAVFLWLPIILVVGFLDNLFGGGPKGEWPHRIAGPFVRLGFRLVPGWRVSVEGEENLRAISGPVVIVVNHESMLDVLAVFWIRLSFRMLGKAEGFRIPGVGWYARMANYVPVNRKDSEDRNRAAEQCAALLRAGQSVLIFPEGTRSRDEKLLPFREGAFRIAIDGGFPLLPVVMSGVRDLFRRPGIPEETRLMLRILPLENGEDYDSPATFAEGVRAKVEKVVAELRRSRAGSYFKY